MDSDNQDFVVMTHRHMDPLARAHDYVTQVNSVAHLPVDHPPGTPLPLALSFACWGAPESPPVGVVLDGHKLIVDECSIEHEIAIDAQGDRTEQRVLIFWNHGFHYHAVTPLRAEVRETPRGFFLRMFTTVIPCAKGTSDTSDLLSNVINELTDYLGDDVAVIVGLHLKQLLGE
jgi:hypothetical protein